MKKIEKVSIAGISFMLDADAYAVLRDYLQSLHSHYDKDPDGAEIIADIEARIAELILDEQVYTKVVALELVETIVAQLGSAQEIDDDVQTDGAPAWSVGGGSTGEGTIQKRLYRAQSPKILGGVCGGLANYFNINVAWVRLIFLLPLIFSITSWYSWHWLDRVTDDLWGISVLAYIILWIAVPMARTPRQVLEGKGEKITAGRIRQNLNSAAKTPIQKRATSVAAEVLIVCGRVLLFFVKFIAACVGFAFVCAGLGILVAIGALVFAPWAVSIPAMMWLPDLAIVSATGLLTMVLILAMLPLLGLGFTLLSFVFGWRLGRVAKVVSLSLVGIWFVILLFCITVIGRNAGYIREEVRGDRLFEYRDGNGEPRHSGEKWRKEIRVIVEPAKPDSVTIETETEVETEAGTEAGTETSVDSLVIKL